MRFDAKEQYEKMQRSLKVLEALASDIGKRVVIGDHAAPDATRHFFEDCYHLKDWLKKDSRVSNPQSIEAYVTSSQALSLAADLCNSFKHAGLDRAPRSGATLDKINMAYSLEIPNTTEPGHIEFKQQPSDGDTFTISRSNRSGSPVATAKVVLTIGGKQYDAVVLAKKCVSDWDSFLKAAGIQFAA